MMLSEIVEGAGAYSTPPVDMPMSHTITSRRQYCCIDKIRWYRVGTDIRFQHLK